MTAKQIHYLREFLCCFLGLSILYLHVRLFTWSPLSCLFVPYEGAKVLIHAVMCRVPVLVPLNVEFGVRRTLWGFQEQTFTVLCCVCTVRFWWTSLLFNWSPRTPKINHPQTAANYGNLLRWIPANPKKTMDPINLQLFDWNILNITTFYCISSCCKW